MGFGGSLWFWYPLGYQCRVDLLPCQNLCSTHLFEKLICFLYSLLYVISLSPNLLLLIFCVVFSGLFLWYSHSRYSRTAATRLLLKSNALWTFFWASFCGRIFFGSMAVGNLYPDLWRVQSSCWLKWYGKKTRGHKVDHLEYQRFRPRSTWAPPAQPCNWGWSRLRAGESPTFGGQQYLNINNIL